MKNLVTSQEINPATFRLVAYCLNQLRNRMLSLGKDMDMEILGSLEAVF
jgi:hypothetical protein